jgi:hypothetical protein
LMMMTMIDALLSPRDKGITHYLIIVRGLGSPLNLQLQHT